MTWKIKRFAPRVTKAEIRFFFTGLKDARIPFQTQVIVQGASGRHYRVDGLVAPNIIVEINGATHNEYKQQIKDKQRDEDLRAATPPFIIIRFKNREVWKNLASCVQTVKEAPRRTWNLTTF